VDAPIVAVPTSSAGAAGFNGLASFAALAGAYAPGVTMVGIDGAVSAAVLAARMMRMAAARVQKLAAANEALAASS
jgi:NCAIR mutase (PurE)-related protein